ncbi:kinase-like domain-containing protein [Glomus cerebriforme]|uniref:Kinase-like domain-containing protein n=1 Tax=Glomus cerebriforme TaxID=658196 RepID=A0A397SK54_9GLOM|nr:kinase-like domain-containing protein [Glomus cerebriforme]
MNDTYDTLKQSITENNPTIGNTINIDTTIENNNKINARNLWKKCNGDYQWHSSIDSTIKSGEVGDFGKKVIFIEDREKRKEVYGICGECNEPGTGRRWCQPCNAKRFKENFKNWTSGNKNIDEFIQQSQLNAVYYRKFLEWIPFENFENVTYITRGGFSKIYSADWPEGFIRFWDIEDQEWNRDPNIKVALKSLDNSFDISTDFLNEINSYISEYYFCIIRCYGITQDPNTKDYMMILKYCKEGNLRKWVDKEKNLNCNFKIKNLTDIISGLVGIHKAGKVHKDFHSGNILFIDPCTPIINDLGMCQPVHIENNKKQSVEGVYGVMPYMAPEILRGYQYTKAADIYSFGIIMNEYISGETPYNDIPHDHVLAVKICKGFRPKISEDTPKLIADLILKCWDVKIENRPTANELYQILKKWYGERFDSKSEIYSQIMECDKIRKNKLRHRPNEKKSKKKHLQTHPQAIYTSRFLNFKNLPEPVNSTDLSLFQDSISSISAPISECLDCELSELDLNQDDDE